MNEKKDDVHPLESMTDGVSRSGVNLIDVVDLPYGPMVKMGVEMTDALMACASRAAAPRPPRRHVWEVGTSEMIRVHPVVGLSPDRVWKLLGCAFVALVAIWLRLACWPRRRHSSHAI